MNEQKRAVLLVNLGSPQSSNTSDVRSYLKEFLTDPCVIDLPAWFRYILVNGIIAPFRSFRSAKLYELLKNDRGFPLIYHSMDLEAQVRERLTHGTDLFLGMRYGEPSLKKIIHRIKKQDYSEIMVLPLYPQYATSTTGSVIRLLQTELESHKLAESTRIVPQFHMHEDFIELWAKKILSFNPFTYDAIVFSFHGIPVRQTQQTHPEASCKSIQCEHRYINSNRYCYRAACFQTTRSISERLKLETKNVYTSFQSRFGRNWLMPFTDQTLITLANEGKKRVLITSPAFVADCLETRVEIAKEYSKLFKNAGGEELTLVPSLNSDPDWAAFIVKLISGSHQFSIKLQDSDLELIY